jgi:hypothetical protein
MAGDEEVTLIGLDWVIDRAGIGASLAADSLGQQLGVLGKRGRVKA